MNSPWDDPAVTLALQERPPEDVYLLPCVRCGAYSYYNQGSHFTCAWCPETASGRRLEALLDAGEALTLAEYTERQVIEETEADA